MTIFINGNDVKALIYLRAYFLFNIKAPTSIKIQEQIYAKEKMGYG